MLKLGEMQTLVIEKVVKHGAYLRDPASGDEKEHVLLPGAQIPAGMGPGDALEVFLYKDSEDRLIATTKRPLLVLHEVGWLTVAAVSPIGAFLSWGPDKDLILPFREQPRERVVKGQRVLAAVYIDRSERLCATMNVYPYLRTDSPYHAGDVVRGTVYAGSDNFGTFVAVDDTWSALIPKKELVRDLKPGDPVEARVTAVRPDGKLDLAIRQEAYLQIGTDADRIMERIEALGGALPFTDKAAPELIRAEMQMSKNEFKRAVGHLLKEGRVRITADSIVKT